tara:strand:- start:77 stop:655 length:579 start_codon:yes stop_codon:yes gene_type:complete
MAIKTITSSSDSDWSIGWKSVTLKEAKYGMYNDDVRYVDAWFEEYPDSINLRLYEAKSKNTGEEFAIAKLFKLANAGILGEVQDSAGKKSLQYDDDAVNLNGKQIQVFFYKNEEGYFRVLNRIAPVVQSNEILSYNEKDVDYWKGQGEKYYEQYKKPSESNDEMLSMTMDAIKETITETTVNTVEDTDEPPF